MSDSLEDDDSFLSYVETHSQTERALFSREHVTRFLRLAGIWSTAQEIDRDPLLRLGAFMEMHWEDIRPTMKLARQRLQHPSPTAKIIPFPQRGTRNGVR